MFLSLAEVLLAIITVWFVVWQMILPAVKGTIWFPDFRPGQKAIQEFEERARTAAENVKRVAETMDFTENLRTLEAKAADAIHTAESAVAGMKVTREAVDLVQKGISEFGRVNVESSDISAAHAGLGMSYSMQKPPVVDQGTNIAINPGPILNKPPFETLATLANPNYKE